MAIKSSARSESRLAQSTDEELSETLVRLRKLTDYASEIEESIAPSIAVLPTLLRNLIDELRLIRHELERLSGAHS